jgi:ubiquinone/menaquinone biosynthesis C-methylase UbiE
VLGVGCGAPTKFAKSGKVIGIDMTDEMLRKARKNAYDNGLYKCRILQRRY